MPIVIGLKRKKRTKEWYFIYLNDGREILSYIDFIIKFKIKTGKQLTEEQIAEIKSSSELISAKETAYKFLSHKPRTQKEVEERLRQKGFDKNVISKVVQEIKNYGFINDLEYARNFVFDRIKSKTLGKVALKQALLAKGISNDIIEQVLSERENIVDEFEIALELANQKLKQIKSSKKKKRTKNEQKRKIYEFLARRGFSWDVINRVMREIFNDLEFEN
ncbi:regulatory protein [Candidatus Kryptobacter tengchongensis]|uniref:Regulatory protein RecX n=1 Tax=Kryptobacter tengchongensis TaxID=1643429 RepID=A0A656D3V8_KRYT1|nr:regulatory protein RecX [Candidatus Kryptobacter tengchongensis]CUS97318.1 regulatory protein [Candidatus Kryptobacter tengchongensis]CUU07875.1 regulatory protein [Candidatus Kryptobacter tengchongensis]CUU09708.1 regulatory protein [Candidatus Kryptobacter tengchongensis]